MDVLLQKLAKKGKKVKLLDESASVKELPRQEDIGDGEQRYKRTGGIQDRFGAPGEFDRGEEIDEDDMGHAMKFKTNTNFLTVEQQEQKRIQIEE